MSAGCLPVMVSRQFPSQDNCCLPSLYLGSVGLYPKMFFFLVLPIECPTVFTPEYILSSDGENSLSIILRRVGQGSGRVLNDFDTRW